MNTIHESSWKVRYTTVMSLALLYVNTVVCYPTECKSDTQKGLESWLIAVEAGTAVNGCKNCYKCHEVARICLDV